MQYLTSKEYIIPFIQGSVPLKETYKVLEIGCAEAGVLKAFLEHGNTCTGIELSESRVELAKSFLPDAVESGQISFIAKDIYEVDVEGEIGHTFDIIVLKDVIEHIFDQERFIPELKKFLAPNGHIFFGFPPWQMPFGGHQQMCRNKFLMYLPFFHLLPMPVYKWVLKIGGESEKNIQNLVDIKLTGISIERFERIIKASGLHFKAKKLFFINPIYTYKFNLKVREQLSLIAKIPVLRNFVSTCAYYLISQE